MLCLWREFDNQM